MKPVSFGAAAGRALAGRRLGDAAPTAAYRRSERALFPNGYFALFIKVFHISPGDASCVKQIAAPRVGMLANVKLTCLESRLDL